jgi:hypothetical protein
MRWCLLGLCSLAAGLCLQGNAWAAQSTTTTGSLTVSMTVQSSISLIFVQSPQVGNQDNCALTGANSSNAALNLGIATTAGDNESCVQFTSTTGKAASYTLQDLVYYKVTDANTSSGSFSLTASLPSTPVTGVAWKLNSTALSSSATSITANGPYNSAQYFTLTVTVASTVTTNNLSQAIDFTATAN